MSKKWIIKVESVIGGNKCVTPFGEINFQTTHETENEQLAEYFKNRIGYSVTEVEEVEEGE